VPPRRRQSLKKKALGLKLGADGKSLDVGCTTDPSASRTRCLGQNGTAGILVWKLVAGRDGGATLKEVSLSNFALQPTAGAGGAFTVAMPITQVVHQPTGVVAGAAAAEGARSTDEGPWDFGAP
jgi:hypothetical protein